MSAAANEKIIISGAGLAGSLQAVYLSQMGYDVELYEYRDDMRKTDMSVGRSINLALSARGMKALEGVGLLEEVMQIAIPMYARGIHNKDGTFVKSNYSKDGKDHINSVSRGELNCKLMTMAEKNGAKINFGYKCMGVNFRERSVTFGPSRKGDESASTTLTPKLLIGADGAYSGVRKAMQRTDRFNYSQEYLKHGYKELTIPPTKDGDFALDKNCLHIWPRGTYMMIALPNLDKSFTCTLFAPYEAPGSDACFAALQTRDQVLAFFNETFADAVPLMPTLLDDFFANPTPSLVTVRCSPWVRDNFAVLVGDSAHAIVPFFGQGMNCAFEDCTVFSACVKNAVAQSPKGEEWPLALSEYNQERIVNANAIADMAIENYVEMRDKTADPDFLFRKEVAHLLGKEFPQHFLARYERVSFSNIPYADAVRIGKLNDVVLDGVIAPLNGTRDIAQIDLALAKELVEQHLAADTVVPRSNL